MKRVSTRSEECEKFEILENARSIAAGGRATWPPDIAVLTSLASDHRDMHGSFEA